MLIILFKVLFGTTDGQIIVMSSTGAMVTQVTVLEGMEITTLIWSCEKFNMEESEDNRDSGVKVTTESGSYPLKRQSQLQQTTNLRHLSQFSKKIRYDIS